MIEIKVSRIGNSRGIRLPASLLKRYQIEDAVLIEEGADSITLRPKNSKNFHGKRPLSRWPATGNRGKILKPRWTMASTGFKRYGIYRADLNPTRGSEINKVRPVGVSLDVLNEAVETVVICPLTTKLHPRWRSRLQIKCQGKSAEIAIDQIRTISKSRLKSKMSDLSPRDAQGTSAFDFGDVWAAMNSIPPRII